MFNIEKYDVRNEYVIDLHSRAEKLIRGKPVLRDVGSIDSIVHHQTGCTFGVSPAMVKKYGGNARLAQFMRAKRVHAHVTSFDEGAVVLAYPLRHYVYHGNGSNPRSLGLENEGLFNGAPGGKNSEPSDLSIETGRVAMTWMVEEAAREGIELRWQHAHRQYSISRRGDPGHRYWQAVAIDHGEKVLGLRFQPDLTDRRGRPIPEVWDPRQVGVAY